MRGKTWAGLLPLLWLGSCGLFGGEPASGAHPAAPALAKDGELGRLGFLLGRWEAAGGLT